VRALHQQLERGRWDRVYASNFNDSGFYIGACQQICDQTVDHAHAHAQYSALGYSGSNSGGALLVENSEFDHNKDGFDTNSQNGDNPPPQNGACPHGGVSPITYTHSCWVFTHNYVHDNNNPNVPWAWPVRGRWAPACRVTRGVLGKGSCLYDQWGDALIGNTFTHNGFYGHPSNGDIAELNFQGGHPTDCYRGNRDGAGGPTSSPSDLGAGASGLRRDAGGVEPQLDVPE